MIQSEFVTDVQYAKMINYLKNVSELLCEDDEIIFMNMIVTITLRFS